MRNIQLLNTQYKTGCLCVVVTQLVARSRAGERIRTITTCLYKLNLALRNQKTKRLVVDVEFDFGDIKSVKMRLIIYSPFS